jgi:hypothetical protein
MSQPHPFFRPEHINVPLTEELRFQIFLAKLLGEKREFVDSGWIATCYYFRGVVYLTELRPEKY